MKVLLLGDANSSHVLKWAKALALSGVDVILYSLARGGTSYASDLAAVVRVVTSEGVVRSYEDGSWLKIQYLRHALTVRRIAQECRPDLVHAHYASSYGAFGALAGFRPLIISVWGSDVFEFPDHSVLHQALLRFNLWRADCVLSTSHAMASRTARFTRKQIEVTPFGVDLKVFTERTVERVFPAGVIVVGTVKTLEPKYGIEYLIRGFKLACDRQPGLSLGLLIVGSGSQKDELERLTVDLGIADRTAFVGGVPHDQVSRYHNMLDIFVALSDSESFGVSVVEASACARPVVVSRVGGLPEVVEDGKTGIVVEPRNAEAAATAIAALAADEALRRRMGIAGRERVERLYDWNRCVAQMLEIYSRESTRLSERKMS